MTKIVAFRTFVNDLRKPESRHVVKEAKAFLNIVIGPMQLLAALALRCAGNKPLADKHIEIGLEALSMGMEVLFPRVAALIFIGYVASSIRCSLMKTCSV